MTFPARPRRPLLVTIAAWGVFLYGAANLWLSAGLLAQRTLLDSRAAVVSPLLRLGAALVWAVLFFSLALSVLRRRPLARLLLPLSLLVFGFYNLGLTWFFVATPTARQGWWIAAVGHGLATLFSAWALNRPLSRPYFLQPDDPPHPDE